MASAGPPGLLGAQLGGANPPPGPGRSGSGAGPARFGLGAGLPWSARVAPACSGAGGPGGAAGSSEGALVQSGAGGPGGGWALGAGGQGVLARWRRW